MKAGRPQDYRPCEIDTCDNLAAPSSPMCWAHLKRRQRGLPITAKLRPSPAKTPRDRLLREAFRLVDDLEAPAGLNPAQHERRAQRRFFRAVRQYAREGMRASRPRAARL